MVYVPKVKIQGESMLVMKQGPSIAGDVYPVIKGRINEPSEYPLIFQALWGTGPHIHVAHSAHYITTCSKVPWQKGTVQKPIV